jgi:hypothetical protein
MRNSARIRSLLAAATIVLLFVFVASETARGREPQAVSGTVVRVEEGILYLKDVRLPDGSFDTGSMMFLLTPRTEYFSGLDRTPGGSVAGGQRVLVRYVEGPKGNEAVLVRILGKPFP